MGNQQLFIELVEYSKSDIQAQLQLTSEQYDDFERTLLKKSIIKLSNNKVKFNYVGVIYFDERLILILPKYMKMPSAAFEYAKVRQLIQLFMKYSQHQKDLTQDEVESFGYIHDEKLSNIFVLADFLMLDYAENGLYTSDKVNRSINGPGEINWNETIEELDMFIIDETPFYPEFYTIEPLLDEEHIIHQIHKAILNEVSAFLTKFEILNIFNYEPLQFDITLEELGELDYLLNCIESEMQVEFSDRKILLLKAMKSYLLKEKFQSTRNQYKLFGTRTFHVVWEKVCSQVFANQYELFKNYIPKPVWTELATNRTAEEATLIPDILVHNIEQNAFFILDAKYYLTQFSMNENNHFGVENNPGIGDVTKQYLYEQTLRRKSEIVRESDCYNIFLMPTEETSEFFGHASIDIFDDEFKGIYLYRQNAETLYDKYLNNETLETTSFKEFIDEHRERDEE